jgi:leucyl aminopeptidase
MPRVPSVTIVDPAADPTVFDKADAVVVGVVPSATGPRLARGAKAVDAAMGNRLTVALKAAGATGRPGQVVKIPTLGLAPFGLVIATGIGSDQTGEAVRRAVGAALRAAAHPRVHIAVDAPIGAIVEGALLGGYRYTVYKSAPGKQIVRRVTVGAAATAENRSAMRTARTVAVAVQQARDLVNTPPNDLYPETFAARAVELAAAEALEIEVLDARALARGRYGGIVAVGAGSARPPRLVRLSYRPRRAVGHVALVGKGITFDSGGLNLKTAHLTWMKSDMAGAAAVLASTVAAAALRLPIAVTATVPMAENMPSGSAYRPSDIVTLRGGRSVEIADTDAEGRLVLADAISRAVEDEPDHLIEVSTLTGAQLIALGPRIIGAMGEPDWRDRVARCGNAAGESVWAMPLTEDLRAGLDSPVADLVNVPPDRWGAMLVGGQFLAEFMPDAMPWVHLDIAGPAWNAGGARDYTPQGGTGAGVRTIMACLHDLVAERG